jgi:hypothetical protein
MASLHVAVIDWVFGVRWNWFSNWKNEMLKRSNKKKKKFKLPYSKIGCPFCWEWLPRPKNVMTVFSGGGGIGGKCECGAVFIVDDVGKFGGQALMDVRALACDGDLDRASEMVEGVDYELKTKAYEKSPDAFNRPMATAPYLQPKVWAIKLITS